MHACMLAQHPCGHVPDCSFACLLSVLNVLQAGEAGAARRDTGAAEGATSLHPALRTRCASMPAPAARPARLNTMR